ncbi:MAG: NosD domain-containing protein, partial [Pirellulales bacterium]
RRSSDLGAKGVFVDQVTYLDPHPLLPGDYPVWENAVPQNVLFADSVWRTDGAFSGNEVGDFDGAHIVGSYNGQLSEELLGGNELFFNVGYFWEHLDVHLWYHGTIPATENPIPNDGTVDVPLDWYGGREPERLESGFAYSRIAGGPRPKQGLLDVENWSANRAAVDFGEAVWPSLFNLAVSGEGGGTLKVGDPLPVVFDHHDNDSDAAASFFLDTDQNPYNAGAVQVGGATLLSTGGATVTDTETLNTAAASAGTYYVSGRLQDASGRIRYAYAPTAIALFPNDNTEPITIAGTNYEDRNGNGQRDSSDPSSGSFEPGLAGWTIRLYLDDGNGLLEPNADTLVDSATTDGSGAYSFTGVEPGQYLIAEVGQNGYVQTFPASSGTHTVTATGGQDVDSLDFGNFGVSRILTVNSADDGADANPGDGVAEDADRNTTLRAAIEEANAVANSADHPDAIFFALPGEGPHTIRPATALPNLKDPVILDATRQAGYSGSPLIELDGSNAGDAVSGLKVTGGGSGSTIRGFTINRFDEHGIFISHKSNVTVRDNYLGTDPTGTQDLGNGEAGVYLINAVNNFVHQNLISGNDQGIFVEGPVSSGNVITGNTIGTNAEGTASLKNRFVNIDIAAGSKNQIGGTAEGEGNLISGSRTGVSIRGTAASGNLLLGNKIGTNAAGTAAIRNTRGVKILDADQNVIGGAGAAGNVISGNTIGLLIQRGESNLVEGNHIGVDVAGSAAVPNTRGVLIRDSQANQIGGAANVISGNLREGLKIFGSSTDNVVSGNAIGTNAAGDAAVGNDMGVRISGIASGNT